MSDLAAFLAARLDEDEAAAKAAIRETAPQWAADGHWALYEHPEEGMQQVCLNENFEDDPITHIARHDPARVLREVEAKRRMLEELDLPYPGEEHLLKLLAAVYRDHPDYDPAWAVSG